MRLLNYDKSMQSLRVRGQYLVSTTAGKIYFSAEDSQIWMIELIDLGTDSKLKTFHIEGYGRILVASTVGTFRGLQVGDYEKFKCRRLS